MAAAVEEHPDRRVYAELLARARGMLVQHLPKSDPLRALLVAGDDLDSDDESGWLMLHDVAADGRHLGIRHPPTGPMFAYYPLDRAYQVPLDPPERVLVAELGDIDRATGRIDAASVFIDGKSVASMIDEAP